MLDHAGCGRFGVQCAAVSEGLTPQAIDLQPAV